MKRTNAVKASYAATVVAAAFALAALPFVIFAGIGLILVLPFGFFVHKEGAFRAQLKTVKPVGKKMQSARRLRVLYCLAGMELMLGLVRWANSGSGAPDEGAMTATSFIYNSLWALAVAFVLFLPQLLSRKK